jgi:hypothetical protein
LPVLVGLRGAVSGCSMLAIFDKGNTIALYCTKRLTSPSQRIMLYANRCEGHALLGNWQRIIAHGFPPCCTGPDTQQ